MEGNLKYIDFSHGFAYDTLIRPVQTILNAVAAGETNEDALMTSFVKGIATSTAKNWANLSLQNLFGLKLS